MTMFHNELVTVFVKIIIC